MPTDLVFHDVFTQHILTPGHPEAPDRLTTAIDYIRNTELMETGKVRLFSPKPADIREIIPLHSQDYLEELRVKSQAGGGFFTPDTASNEYTYKAALTAAGGGIAAVDRVLNNLTKNAYVLCRPPGHHAERSRAFGFCFINNIAVAARHLIKYRGLERVMIVDYDAHHGNGTQNAFYSTNQVLYVGIHQDGRTLFPGSGFPDELGTGEGEGYNVNLAMYPGAGDVSFGIVYDEIILPIADSFRPEFILVSAGFDSHFSDPLTSLGLTHDGLASMNRKLNSLASSISDERIVFFLEGGYNLAAVGAGSQNLVEELAGADVTDFGETKGEDNRTIEYTESLVSFLRENLEGVFF